MSHPRQLSPSLPCVVSLLIASQTACIPPEDFLSRPDGDTATIAAPSEAQLELDLPRSLAPSTGNSEAGFQALSEDRSPCEAEPFPGPLFACLTRHVIHDVAVQFTQMVTRIMHEVVAQLTHFNVPPDQLLSISDGKRVIELIWSEVDAGREYQVELFDYATGEKLGRWYWIVGDDGSATGDVRMLENLFTGADAPRALRYAFESDPAGTSKHVELAVSLPDPRSTDPGAPTALHLIADRSPELWTVRYATAHPRWLSPEIDGGVPTVLMATALAGTTVETNAAMHVIALPGDAPEIPAGALSQNSVCNYVVPRFEEAGIFPPGAVTCGDGNPYYVYSDGQVIEGGEPPQGFEDLASLLHQLDFISADPSSLWNIDVGL